MVLVLFAVLMRFVRASMLEQMNRDYVRTARAKGLRNFVVVNRHILRNALIPVMTVLSINFVGDGLRDALDPQLRQR